MNYLIEEIRTLSPSYGSIPFWSWNDKLEEPELRRQIRHMKDLGMNGFFMHARGGLETEYLSDDWFACIEACVDEAKKVGMEAWSYDENGWPSGFAGGALLHDKENFALSIEHREGAFPPPPKDADDDEIIAVYRRNPDGSFTHVTEDTGEESYLLLYRRYDDSYVDTLNKKVIDKFIAETHEVYKKRLDAADFGTAMPGFFTDEPQYYRWGHPYSNILPDEFRKAYGLDLYEDLPALFFDYEGADTFRYRYYYLIHRLFITAYIKNIYDWCRENGCSLTGHAVEETSLGGQMMCIGGCMPFYEYESIPGMDYLGRGIADDIACKQLGSAAAQTGRKKVLSEMFGCCGWDVSPTELKRIAESQYAGGVNLMCQHLYPYSERGQRKRDYPQHYSEHNPWDGFMPAFDRYFNHLGAALSRGQEYAPVLVLHPIHGAYCKYKKDDPSSLAEIDGKFTALSRLLGQNQVPYHYGDEWMMQRLASVQNGRITVGRCTYDTIIVPFTYSLDRSTVALLQEFLASGGKLWLFDRKPDCIDGEKASLDWLEPTCTWEDILGKRDVVLTRNGRNVPELRKMTRITADGERLVFLTNLTDRTLGTVRVTLPPEKTDRPAGKNGPWYLLDLDTLETHPLWTAPAGEEKGELYTELPFADAQSYMLVYDTANEPLPSLLEEEPEKPVLPSAFIPVPETVRLTAHPANILTLDTAERSADGVHYDEPLPIVGIKDNLLREQVDGTVYLRFSFTLDYRPDDLRAVLEPMYTRVTVNGTEVQPDPDAWWFDRSFASAQIAPLTHPGRNDIVVEINHHQRPYVYRVLYGGGSESLRNCLSFDTEVEAMYLVGDFAVRCDGIFCEQPHHAVTYDGTFTLVQQPAVVPAENVVRGGFPFYGGRLDTAFPYTYTAGKPTVLSLPGRFAAADITVNGTPAGTMLFSRTLDLADFLREGENTIGVTLYNSMRNTMGPHHRGEAEPYGVGPGTFSFEKEWNGRVCGSYVPTYAFVHYGLK